VTGSGVRLYRRQRLDDHLEKNSVLCPPKFPKRGAL